MKAPHLCPPLLVASTLACSVGVPPMAGDFGGQPGPGQLPDPGDDPGSTSGGDAAGSGSGSTGGTPDLGADLDPEPGPGCGNGVLEAGEACDDGNLDDADGCESDCTVPACANGVADPGEWCHAAALVPLPGPSAEVAAGDLNGDGQGTAVAVLPDHNRVVTVDLGPGAPIVGQWLAGVAPRRLALGDLDLDGRLDAVVLTDAGLERLPGAGAGFGPTEVLYPRNDIDAFAVAQIDLDGRLDLVVTRPTSVYLPGEPAWIGDGLEVLAGDGAGGVEGLSFQTTSGPTDRVAVGELTPDGLPDMVLAGTDPSGVRVLAGSKPGHVDPVAETITGPIVGLSLVHTDEDGYLDVVLATEGSSKLTIRPGDGTGKLGTPSFVNLGSSATALHAADMDADGVTDLLVATDAAELQILRGHGHAQYTTEHVVPLTDTATSLATTDLDGNGIPDVVAGGAAIPGLEIVLAVP